MKINVTRKRPFRLKIKINKLEKSKPGNKYLIKKVDFTADFLSLIDEDFKNNTIILLLTKLVN